MKLSKLNICSVVAVLLSAWAFGVTMLPAATVVQFSTTLGSFDVELFDGQTPATVSNFLYYADNHFYDNSLIQRSVPGFIEQGGGFYLTPDYSLEPIPVTNPVVNEFGISNTRGTIAMAKVGGDPNSATSQWFFNLADNSANLDHQNGGFTVFGKVLGDGMNVVDAFAAAPVYNATAYNPAFAELPLVGVTNGQTAIQLNNLILVNTVSVVPEATTSMLLALGVLLLAMLRFRLIRR
jgi:peptidyl-prolyl cis-trans isomerase A (cyclophilin A)